jgi:bifunctional aspartokinase / homoserine dehydrogenase 1
MKFGGTSVADADCIEKVATIVRSAALDNRVVVVVSAMSGVTNKLVDAATQAEKGKSTEVKAVFKQLRRRHGAALDALVRSSKKRNAIAIKMERLFQEVERLCESAIQSREMSLQDRDSVLSLGERLSAPLVAVALERHGLNSEAIEATELITTDSCHGVADPQMEPTRRACIARLLPIVEQHTVPVTNGFIGSTIEGKLTTLGRGGSDYSATILGAAVDADEVIIWTDVDGLATADPRLVPGARTIPEVSYREASELAYFGAKVLHPKTLRPVVHCGIPLRIRNTFFPERPGTKITPDGPAKSAEFTGLAAINDVTLIKMGGLGIDSVLLLARVRAILATAHADLLSVLQSSTQNEQCVVIPSAMATTAVTALSQEVANNFVADKIGHFTPRATGALVTLVGRNICGSVSKVARASGALRQANVTPLAQGSSESSISFVVAKQDMVDALKALHRDFCLGTEPALSFSTSDVPSAKWVYASEPPRAEGD